MAPKKSIELEFNDFTSFFDPNSYSVRAYTERSIRESYKEIRGRFVEEALIRIQSGTCVNSEEEGKIENKISVIQSMKYAWICSDCAKKIGKKDEFESYSIAEAKTCFICKDVLRVAEIKMAAWYDICLASNDKDLVLLYSILEEYFGNEIEPFNKIFEKKTVGFNTDMVNKIQEKLFSEIPYHEFRNCETVNQLLKKINEHKKVRFNRYTALTVHK